ncbi:hypothetical protein Sme01_42290 [Sphaerisporangium melleum]|uniref:Uncharacterized protein n=1 Tax=Sphaerisporangium melleum TaxID=321316 RepID=A0A917VT06_9ACTN|nr:hypothetical protein GCM10007964_61740 [Sphaerisporangium melleum]GII71753.1 hypothetical protein Sme01_42290 [Sphaerisporangium melleum]
MRTVSTGADAVEADAALARGRILHARFLNDRDSVRRGIPSAGYLRWMCTAAPGADSDTSAGM